MVQFLGTLLSRKFQNAAWAQISRYFFSILFFIYGSILLHFEETDAEGAPDSVLKF